MKYLSWILIVFVVLGSYSCRGKSEEKTQKEAENELKKIVKNPKGYLLDHRYEIIEGLKDPDPKKRQGAIWDIVNLKIKDAIPQLNKIAENDPDIGVRNASLVALSSLGGEKEIPAMLKALENPEVSLRMVVAFKLTKLHRKEGIAALIDILDSGNKNEEINTYNYLQKYTKRDFGDIFIKNKPGLIPLYLVDPEKKKEVFARWKQWWKEEGDKFEFPKE